MDELLKAIKQKLADDDPFTGAMACSDVTEVTITGTTINDLTWKDFRDAVYLVIVTVFADYFCQK
jgi:hypothetical protein